MKKISSLYRRLVGKNVDSAKIEIPPLSMELIKIFPSDTSNEVSLIIPRVEIIEKIETPFFKKTKETIYNSITIVNTPKDISGKESNIEIPYISKTVEK